MRNIKARLSQGNFTMNNPTRQSMTEHLIELEAQTKLSESSIWSSIKGLRLEGDSSKPCQEWIYETMAFAFSDRYSGQNSWGLYYGPIASFQGEEGVLVEIPDLARVDVDALDYWANRGESCKNPIMKSRYLDLVWELSEQCTGNKPSHNFAILCCESNLEVVEHEMYANTVAGKRKLLRSIDLACRLNNTDLIARIRTALISFEDKTGEDSKAGSWGYCLEELIENRRAGFSTEEEEEIVNKMELRLQRLVGSDPWACERAGRLLAQYFRRRQRNEEASRVIQLTGKNFEQMADNAGPMLAVSWLDNAHRLYSEAGLVEDAGRVAGALGQKGPEVVSAMHLISHSVKIEPEKLETFVSAVLEGTLNEALARVASHFVPSQEELEDQLRTKLKVAPIAAVIPQKIFDEDGRYIAKVGSIEEDWNGNKMLQLAQNLAISSVLLEATLVAAINKFGITENSLVDLIFESPVFAPNRRRVVTQGMRAYLAGDHCTAIHLLVPQIEAAVRNLVAQAGGTVLVRNERGEGFKYQTDLAQV